MVKVDYFTRYYTAFTDCCEQTFFGRYATPFETNGINVLNQSTQRERNGWCKIQPSPQTAIYEHDTGGEFNLITTFGE